MDWLTSTEFAAWVTASCVRQGVPVKVTDSVVVARVAVLLSGGTIRPEGKRQRSGIGGLPDQVELGPQSAALERPSSEHSTGGAVQ